ncbi:MAG: PIG-L deacetylase family protein [Ilumatobacteraceae bacterium]|jgi:LmbE family N-acetylglucosaminyl deacetylase
MNTDRQPHQINRRHAEPHRADQHAAARLGTVLAVWAHPDDESFVAGGLLAAASDAGSRIVCLTATRGERGSDDAERWHPDRLGRTRSRELAAAQAIIGIHEQRWLPFEDGECHAVSPGRGMGLVASVIDDVCPDTIVTFGPDGLTGHTDHQAVSRWTSHAWAARRTSARLLWAAITSDTQRRMWEAEPIAKAFYPGYPEVASERSVAIQLDLTGDMLDRKFSAIRAHATQSATLVHRLGEEQYRQWWSTESYIDVGAGAADSSSSPRHRQHVPGRRQTRLHPPHVRTTRRSSPVDGRRPSARPAK